MKVILKEYVYMQGVAGDIVEVADGFARNYLIPQGKAIKATQEAIERNREMMAKAAMRREELNNELVGLSNKINDTELIFVRKAERNDKLYGSVTTMDIAEQLLEKTGVDIDRRRISDRPLREIGEYEIPIRMGQDLAPVVKVIIVREDSYDDFLAEREAAQAAAEAMPEGAEEDVPADAADAGAEIGEAVVEEAAEMVDVAEESVEEDIAE